MNVQIFALPDLGEGLTEARLVRWLVRSGDLVEVDAPVAEVETAKAVVEVPTPFPGVITARHGDEGSPIQVGDPLISVRTDARPEEETRHGSVFVGYRSSAAPERPRVASPLVRRLLHEQRLDAAAMVGSGPDGLITREDVERAAAAVREPPAGTDRRTGLAVRAVVPLRGVRGATAQLVTRSRQEIPEATTWVDVDVTALLQLREDLRYEERKPGLPAMIGRFVVAGLRRFPELNSRVDAVGKHVVQLEGVNLGIAVQTDRGLFVPSVRDAHLLNIREVDAEMRRLVSAARNDTVTSAELSRGSFTLNNYGVFGVDGSAGIINHPEAAILGIGRILPRPWAVEQQVVVRQVTQLSLVFDHRVCDGRAAAGFLRFVADVIEQPLSFYALL